LVIKLGFPVHAPKKPGIGMRSTIDLREGACTNDAESFFSRVRRAEIGIHHHLAGPYFAALAWREDNRQLALLDVIISLR
jgi:hypothetical protein